MSTPETDLDVELKMMADGSLSEQNNTANGTTAETSTQPKKCLALRAFCHSCTKPVRTKYNPLPHEATLGEKFCYTFMCPPHGRIAKYIMFVVMFFVSWAVMMSLTGSGGLPGGNFFSLVIMFFACVVGGYLVVYVKLPPLLGKFI
jgi:hypothetical protein